MARGLRLARTMSLGIIINLAYYYENAEILAAVESAAASAGYVTLIADTADFVSRGEAYRRLLFERRVDGLLIASIFVPDEFIHELKEEGLPFVLINRRVAGIGPSATVDDELGMRMAVDHLVGLGHRRIGYLAGPAHLDPASRRLAGFRSGMHAAGLRAPARLVRQCPVDDESVLFATEQLLEGEPRPTAIAVWSPTAAVPALAAARRLGIRVPEHMSVIAYNDSPIAGYLEPPLTTVHMPLAEMARGGGRLPARDDRRRRAPKLRRPDAAHARSAGVHGARPGARLDIRRGSREDGPREEKRFSSHFGVPDV